jgi:REP element-mobilizing transposase RayT
VRTGAFQQRLFAAKDMKSPAERRKRPNAGRPPKGPRSSERHERRPRLLGSQPVHVVIRLVRGLGSLRSRGGYEAVRAATIVVAHEQHAGFRIVHLSVQRNHVHLIVEAADRLVLARGMKAFQISAAKHINRLHVVDGKRRRGTVFGDRYHATILSSPRQVRNTLAYVLNNWRRHQEDHAKLSRTWQIDPFSSGILFGGWKELEAERFMPRYRETYRPMIVWLPKTWLLSTGWRRHGLIQQHEVPRGDAGQAERIRREERRSLNGVGSRSAAARRRRTMLATSGFSEK